jgi:hypothetical protein
VRSHLHLSSALVESGGSNTGTLLCPKISFTFCRNFFFLRWSKRTLHKPLIIVLFVAQTTHFSRLLHETLNLPYFIVQRSKFELGWLIANLTTMDLGSVMVVLFWCVTHEVWDMMMFMMAIAWCPRNILVCETWRYICST